jgi:hypothetical protein
VAKPVGGIEPVYYRPGKYVFAIQQDEIEIWNVRNAVQRGHRFQRKADSIPVIADSR